GADVTSPPGSLNRQGMGVAFGDYDGDGYLDMLTSDHSRPTASNGSRLLRNLGAANPGHFEDVTHAAGLDVYRAALAVTDPPNAYRFQPQFSDLDRDGRLDIVISADSRTSQLFWNNGDGTFTDGTVPAGVGTDKSGMGSTLGDYDRDGDLDWFVTAIYDTTFLGANPGNRLFRNNGNRTFTDVTTAAGVRATGPGLSWGWGTTFFDYDNDADVDLVATDGFVTGYSGDRTTLWRNNLNGTFTDVSVASGITDTGQGRGLLDVDFDNDGDLDVVIANYAAAPIVYRNDGGNQNHWLRVEAEGTISNRDGIGAFIKVTPDMDQPQSFQVWEIRSGDSYLSQSEMTAHFGLGDFTGTVDLVEIEWPASGIEQRYVDVPVDSTLSARERLLGDFNGDGYVDAADYTMWRNSEGMTGDDLAADVAGPQGLPDGVVDQLDYWYWKANFGLSYAVGGGANQATASVPEPAGCIGLAAGLAIVGARERNRRKRRVGSTGEVA
ncbi:MAG: FG-GAP-like repeat-containing protein, partial [Pirellulales bacterium]